MKRGALAFAAVALVAGSAGYGIGAATQSSSAPSRGTLVPACPHPTFGADGTMGPLFCRIDNPLAIAYYGPVVRELIALGPNASPSTVADFLDAHTRHQTGPFRCDIYALAAWANHWYYGDSTIAGPYCSAPFGG